MMARSRHHQHTDSSFGISEVHSLPGLDTTRLAASLPTLPVGLACHGRSSEQVGENEMSMLTGGEQANIDRGDDLKVRPTECCFVLLTQGEENLKRGLQLPMPRA